MSEKYYPSHKRLCLYGYWYRFHRTTRPRWILAVFDALSAARFMHRTAKGYADVTPVFCVARSLSVPRAHYLRKEKP
jgi:hypothetical protein